MFDNIFIWAQVVGFISVCINVVAWQLKNSRHIIMCHIPARAFMATQYIMLGAPLGAVMDICCAFRDSGITFLKEKYVPLLILLSLCFIWCIGLYFFENWYDALALTAVTIAHVALFHRKNRALYTRITIISPSLFIIYNVMVGSWMGAICAVFVITSSIIGMYRHEGWNIKNSPTNLLKSLFTIPSKEVVHV